MRYRLIGLYLLLFVYQPSLAQDVRFYIRVSQERLGMKEYLQVQYMVEEEISVAEFSQPVFTHFKVLEGPDKEMGVSNESGLHRSYVLYNYVLQPLRSGRCMIPAATIRVGRKSYTCNPVFVEVVGEDQAGLLGGDMMMRRGENIASKVKGNIFVRLELDKQRCYVGEPVVATYTLYTRLQSNSRVVRSPSFNGFSVVEMMDGQANPPVQEEYAGKRYTRYVLRKVQLYPLHAGTFRIDPIEVENELTFFREERISGEFGLSLILKNLEQGKADSAIIKDTLLIRSGYADLNVKALPVISDSSFDGAVGMFSVSSHLSSQQGYQGDQLNLQVKVEGKGNFTMISPPVINWPDGIEVFEPSVKEQYAQFVSPMSGTKIFTIPFVIRKAGDWQIPPATLLYFDPVKQKYVEVKSASVALKILPAVRPQRSRPMKLTDAASNYLWWIVSIILSVSGFTLWFIRRRSKKQQVINTGHSGKSERQVIVEGNGPDSRGMNYSYDAASAIASGRRESLMNALARLEVLSNNGNAESFYHQMEQLIDEILQVRMGIADFGNWKMKQNFQGLAADIVDELYSLREKTVRIRYMPGTAYDLKADFSAITRIVKSLENRV